jgi:integral membrane protein
VKTALLRYRVMAYIVGCFVIVVFGCFFAQLATDDQSWFNQHEGLIQVIDQVHGFLYMIFLVMAALLARKARWTIPFTITTLLAGTIPIVSFWAEHRATKAVRAEHPELV